MKMLGQISRRFRLRAYAVGLGVAAFSAAACVVHYGPQFHVNVGGVSVLTPWKDIGAKVQQQLGSVYGKDHDVEGVIAYSVKLPFGLTGGLHSVPFHKPCGVDFKEAAQDKFKAVVVGGGSASVCAVEAGNPVVTYKPVYQTGSSCTPSGCHTETQLVGYEPVHAKCLSVRRFVTELPS